MTCRSKISKITMACNLVLPCEQLVSPTCRTARGETGERTAARGKLSLISLQERLEALYYTWSTICLFSWTFGIKWQKYSNLRGITRYQRSNPPSLFEACSFSRPFTVCLRRDLGRILVVNGAKPAIGRVFLLFLLLFLFFSFGKKGKVRRGKINHFFKRALFAKK